MEKCLIQSTHKTKESFLKNLNQSGPWLMVTSSGDDETEKYLAVESDEIKSMILPDDFVYETLTD